METTEIVPTVFTFADTNLIAVMDGQGKPWFRANEICEILGYANPRQAVKKNCKPKGVSTRDTLTVVPAKEKPMETTELTTHTFGEITLRGFMDDEGNPFFVAADVANALDYRDAPNMVRILAEDEIAGTRLVSSRSENGVEQDREMTIITLRVKP